MEIRDFLGSVPFFAETLSSAELDALAADARQVRYDRGAPLIREDEFGDSMFVVRDGTVTVSIHDSGTDRPVATLGPGEIVGEMSLLTGDRRAATVTAETPVVAIEIERSAVHPLLVAEPALFDRFAETLEKRRRELDRLHGPGLLRFYGPPRDDLAIVIRTYFAGLPRAKGG